MRLQYLNDCSEQDVNKTRDPAMTVNIYVHSLVRHLIQHSHPAASDCMSLFPGDGTVGVNDCTEVTQGMPGLLQSSCDSLLTRGISLTIKHS